ncbi:MAG: MGMT family protein [Planctomycetaceae bacterium]|nr:MGMT family protein [Planctomycetaceae bacterium]
MRNLSLVELRRRLENPPDLYRDLWQLIEQIPLGTVSTYRELAQALGDRVATRWVGKVLFNHLHTNLCHCHRIVRVSGELGKFVTGEPE